MKRIWGSLALVVVLACGGWTQNAPADTPADKEDIEKLFTTLHLREMMRNVMATSMQQSKQIAHDALRRKQPGISDEELKRMDGFIDDSVKSLDIVGMLDDMIPVYQRHLSKQDIQAMLAFYETPTGQKILREQPAMMSEGMQAMRPRMERMMADVMDKAEAMAKQESENKTSGPVAK
jgi:hypothetical protein